MGMLTCMDRLTQQWLDRAAYDLETARALLHSKRYLYVAFMCQQSIEKLLKAYVSARGATPPFVHNLVRLAEASGLRAVLSPSQQLLLADLNPYYIKARYGEYKDALAKVCTADKAAHFLQATEEVIQWLQSHQPLKAS